MAYIYVRSLKWAFGLFFGALLVGSVAMLFVAGAGSLGAACGLFLVSALCLWQLGPVAEAVERRLRQQERRFERAERAARDAAPCERDPG